jgi:arginase
LHAVHNFSGAHVLQIPYASGRRNSGTGNGPARLAEQLVNFKSVSPETITVEERSFELATTIPILRAISEKVEGAMVGNRFPILLAGGCSSTVGALSRIGAESTGLIWFDAHGDFNTPESTPSGFVDGMALAMATGRCWRTLVHSIPGFRPFPEKNVVLIGAHDLDPEERTSLERSEITWLRLESIRKNGVENALGGLLSRLPERVYLHVDLDVIDCEEARVNQYSAPGGMKVSELLHTIRFIGDNRAIAGASVTAYDPSVDHDSKGLHAGVAVIKQVLAGACIDIS